MQRQTIESLAIFNITKYQLSKYAIKITQFSFYCYSSEIRTYFRRRYSHRENTLFILLFCYFIFGLEKSAFCSLIRIQSQFLLNNFCYTIYLLTFQFSNFHEFWLGSTHPFKNIILRLKEMFL